MEKALERLREAFARYPRRAVLEGCPHCRGSVTVDDHDLFSLTISLGNTVGTSDDVKSFVPLLLERLTVGYELDPSMVMAKLTQEHWRTWPTAEQKAIDDYLMAVWRTLLTTYPAKLGSLSNASDFLSTVEADDFLKEWDNTQGIAPDRHLASLVEAWIHDPTLPTQVINWLRRDVIRERLYKAFERDHTEPWSNDFARAHDYLT
ncbi:hypothetical protein ACIBG8_44225 [Nonomuraea sp. NPDC050556]|uniref:hypothetical protein n=1 Tax=Nonomuraea sp. NPDC050556 TaxID=3364369 RepID=UPI0037A94D1D